MITADRWEEIDIVIRVNKATEKNQQFISSELVQHFSDKTYGNMQKITSGKKHHWNDEEHHRSHAKVFI